MIYHDLTGHDLTGDGAEEAVVRVRYGGSSSILDYHVYTIEDNKLTQLYADSGLSTTFQWAASAGVFTLMDVQVAAAPTT